MLYHSFETLSLLSFFYLMVKSGKSFVKIESHFQIALFLLFYRNFHPPPPLPHLFRPPANLILPNVSTPSLFPPPRLLGSTCLFGTQEYLYSCIHIMIQFERDLVLRKFNFLFIIYHWDSKKFDICFQGFNLNFRISIFLD